LTGGYGWPFRLRWAVESHLTRWTIEETSRFIKQFYQLEDIRLPTFFRPRNMKALGLAAAAELTFPRFFDNLD
jgi:hypothetical protein